MAKYSFRSKYYDQNGNDLIKVPGVSFDYISSVVPVGGDGTRENPLAKYRIGAIPAYRVQIFSNGIHHTNPAKQSNPQGVGGQLFYIGNGMFSTVLNMKLGISFQSGGTMDIYFKDLSLQELTRTNDWGNGYGSTHYFYNCIINNKFISPGGTNTMLVSVKKCILYIPNSGFTDNGQNSYISTDIVNAINSLALYGNCNVTLDTQARLTSYLNTYAAFNDCKFKIGNEAGWTALNGTTEAEYRADFVARCQAQGWTVPTGTEFGDTNMPMYRWVFTNGSSKNGVPMLNGIIHNFEKRRFVTFGYEPKRAGIVVSSNPAAINSFNPGTPEEVLELADNTIAFPVGQDITDRVIGAKESNIMWLGGKVKLTALDVIHDMPIDYGVMVDNTSTIDFTPVTSGSIQPDELYIVRSTDKQYAAITYNGVAYNTSLANNVQVFKGVSGQTGYTVTDGTPVIYRITDFVQQQTIGMRIVNKLPADIITTGALLENYWYFVEHDTDQSNTTDYITYNGNNYYSGSSFLVQAGVTSFTITGTIHLRRCWHKDFDWETMQPTDVDYNFWQNEQKPKWCKIVLGDTPRCFMTANNNRQNEMQSDENGEYLTTGNPAFYRMENGDGGIVTPSFLVQGTFIQFKIEVTTVNPM